jgi:5-(carboxyamino)imidazole ribonucleotide synthase
MLALAGHPLGIRMRFLDPAADACAGDVGELLVGDYGDEELLDRLSDGTDVVTLEFENVSVEAARRAGALPGPTSLEHSQDRLREKELFRRLGIPTARFGSIENVGLPALVKARRLGYDGKGQRLLTVPEPLGADELAEELVTFERELSVIAVRSRVGETAYYPLVENEHRQGILRVSRAPATASADLQAQAMEYARRLLDALDHVGVLALELFEIGGRLLANEYAPRVHNTGHWTIEGAETSQFENHLRAILGHPLGETASRGSSVMVNLIGHMPPLATMLDVPSAHVHLYGKAARPGRKVGHVTLVDADAASAAGMIRLAAVG